eukprot:6911674-Ditylum_brightwellii.AAC.1
MVSQAQLHMAETGLFDKEYLTWIKHLQANKTWNDFKTYWMEKFGDYDLLHQLTSKEGALGAHAATASKESDVYDWEEAMENLAYATTASNTQLETLVKTNTQLSAQLRKALNNNKKLTKDNSKLIQIIAQIMGGQNITPPARQDHNTPRGYDPNGYCWSHRYRVTRGYNSQTCKKPKGGHRCEATWANTMGGSKAFKNWTP